LEGGIKDEVHTNIEALRAVAAAFSDDAEGEDEGSIVVDLGDYFAKKDAQEKQL